MAFDSRLLCVIVAAALLGSHAPPALAETPYRVIVNPSVKGTQITRAGVSAIFLKQVRKWGDGSAAFPVDQSLRSPVRESFSRAVLRQEIDAISIYWQQQMARGLVPPMVKPSDEAVVSFVASTAGAIGYVSAETTLPESVRILTVVD